MVKVVLVGLGTIGSGILAYLMERKHEVVGVVDSDPAKAGRTVREITKLESDVRVHGSVTDLDFRGAEVTVFATTSRLAELAKDLEHVLSQKVFVVSTCEELAFPDFKGDENARMVDGTAKENEVAAIGVGVNPGFVMDWVPAVVATASKSPTSIHVVRSLDVSRRRKQLQAKMGVGLTKAEFEKRKAGGGLGHVGLVESLHLIAVSMGGELGEVRTGIFPVVGSDEYVLGARQFAESRVGGCQLRLDLEMTLTSADFDVIDVKGDPHLKVRFEGGVFGDSATVALAVSAVERIRQARPGLVTVLELPLGRP